MTAGVLDAGPVATKRTAPHRQLPSN
jgi:hypothetical protein